MEKQPKLYTAKEKQDANSKAEIVYRMEAALAQKEAIKAAGKRKK